MLKNIVLPLTAAFLFPLFAFSAQPYPLQEYELVVLESLPEALSLDMTLSEIEQTKETSRLGALKRRLNKTIFDKMAPLLASANFSSSFNLLQLPKLLPLGQIVEELNRVDANQPNPAPADFIIMISPKLPADFSNGAGNPYSLLYPMKKGAVLSSINEPNALVSYEARINQRMLEGANFLFQRQYQSGDKTKGFFAGALIAIHAEGTKSTAKAKLALGLPTDQSVPFEQEDVQIKLSQLVFPRAPYDGYVFNMENPIAMITFEHTASGINPPLLKMAFGSLGPMQNNSWYVGNTPSDATVSRWFSWMNPYNVPHFRGEIRSIIKKEMLGWFGGMSDWLNGVLGNNFDIQLNLHEVTIDLSKIEITDVKLTVDLPWKGSSEILPTFRNADPEQQFKNEGNKVLKEQKDKVQAVLENGLLILNDEKAQKLLIDTINDLISSENTGAAQ